MSRHEIPARLPNARVVVGWDRPLGTFFGQVHRDDAPEHANPVVWVGESYREIRHVEDLAHALRDHAEITPATASLLHGDRGSGL